MKLSIIIPVFNEEKTIEKILEKLSDLKIEPTEKEIIIVDDGSSDKTEEIIKNFIKNHKSNNFKFFQHKINSGKGAAIKTGIEHANGDYIIIQDADLEYDPKFIPLLLKPIIDGKAKVVYGTRLQRLPNLQKEERRVGFLLHYLGNRFLSLTTSLLYGQWITDMETCYKLFPKNALKDTQLNSKRFDFEPEITAKLLKKGYRILEVPISTNPRGYEEGKKISALHDGPIALNTLIKYRFKN